MRFGLALGVELAVFFLWDPVKIPAKSIKNLFEKLAAIDVFDMSHTGDEPVDISVAVGGEFVGGAVTVAADAFAGDDETGIDHGANEGDTFVGGLFVLFLGVKGEFELAAEVLFDNFDIAQELFVLIHGYEDEKVIHIAPVVFISEVKLDIAIELVEENIREELAGEVADDDTAPFGLIEKAFTGRELLPVGALAADGDVVHRLVEDDFVPEVAQGIVEAFLIIGMTTDTVFAVGAFAVVELLFQTPEDPFVEFLMIQAHKISLDVKLDSVGGDGVILGDLTEVMSEALLTIECAFAFATGIGIGDETPVPPFRANIEEKMVHDAVAEGCGDDFSNHGVADNKSHAAAGLIVAAHDTIAQVDGIFHGIELVAMLVDSMAFAFACGIVGDPELVEQEPCETGVVVITHYSWWLFVGLCGVVCCIRGR